MAKRRIKNNTEKESAVKVTVFNYDIDRLAEKLARIMPGIVQAMVEREFNKVLK